MEDVPTHSEQRDRLERVIELAQCLIDDLGLEETKLDHTKHSVWLHSIRNTIDLCIGDNRC